MRLSYRNNGYASSVVLAAFAREALGQWKILLALRREVIGGKPLTVSEVKNRCSSHVQKQAAGMLSITMRADQGHGAGQLLMSRMTAKPGSEESTVNRDFTNAGSWLHRRRSKRLRRSISPLQ